MERTLSCLTSFTRQGVLETQVVACISVHSFLMSGFVSYHVDTPPVNLYMYLLMDILVLSSFGYYE